MGTATTADGILKTVEKTIAKHGLLEKGNAVLVGLSGGPDSVALLWCLNRLAPAMSLRVAAAHLNHALRGPAADSDAAFAAAFADRLGLPCYMKKVNVSAFQKAHGLGMEEAARILRYDFLSATATANGYTQIALGHHADDNAELVLMNFLRGSGLAGLGGIPVKRPLAFPGASTKAPMIVRPLMGLTREQILHLLKSNDLSWRTDQSNHDTMHLRNRVRHDLLPLLKRRFNPNIVETLNRTALLARQDEGWIQDCLSPLMKALLVQEGTPGVSLSIGRLREHPPSVAARVVREAFRKVKGDLRTITFSHVASVLALCRTGRCCGRLDLPERIRVERRNDTLRIYRSERPLRETPWSVPAGTAAPAPAYRLEAPGSATLEAFSLVMNVRRLTGAEARTGPLEAGQLSAFFDMDKITFPLVVRTFQPGDRFQPLGAGGTQKLKKFFIDHKVPPEARRQCPLLESAGRILWVVGHRIDERFKLTDSTQRALKVELTLAESLEKD